MNEQNKPPQNPSAFPSKLIDHQESAMQSRTVYNGQEFGMTLRDYFAAKAMQSLVLTTTERKISIWSKILIFFGLNGWVVDYELSEINISKSAYSISDAMLKQREL